MVYYPVDENNESDNNMPGEINDTESQDEQNDNSLEKDKNGQADGVGNGEEIMDEESGCSCSMIN